MIVCQFKFQILYRILQSVQEDCWGILLTVLLCTAHMQEGIMLLVSLTEDQIKTVSNRISDLAFDYMLIYGIDISPVITNTDHFNYWVDNLPYYRSVRDEGVKISA